MTAKTKHGHKAHRATHGADPGTAHERLNRRHAQVGRPEGAMHQGGEMAPPMAAPPQPQDNVSMAPPGAGPTASGGSTDDESGDQT